MGKTSERFALAAIVLVALLIRVVPPHPHVFQGDRVVFASNDPWVHMRNVDNIAAHWPWPTWFDPYRLAPEGMWPEAPLMDILIAGIANATGLPLDVVGAWFPAVTGALVPVPVFLLMRRLFGSTEASIAALLVAVLPGQLLQRSLLGFTDHHVLEALLASTMLLGLAWLWEKPTLWRQLACGVVLGLYLWTWSRGVFLVLILLLWGGLEAMVASGRRFHVTRTLSPVLAIALLMILPIAFLLPAMTVTLPITVAGIAAIAAAEAVAARLPHRVAPFVTAGLGAVTALAAWWILPDVRAQVTPPALSAGAASIGEIQPMLFPGGRFSLEIPWLEFTTAALLAPAGLILLAPRARDPQAAALRLVLVFGIVVLAATLMRVRFAYYLAAPAAMLAAVAAARWLWRGLDRRLALVAIAAIVIYPNLPIAFARAAGPNGAPPPAWLEALGWIRDNTPEPYGSADQYYARWRSKETAPQPSYGVMVWWDYGWWVTRIARRPPSTNPTQDDADIAARFFTSTGEAQALEVLRDRKAGYVIADRSIPVSVETAGRAMASQLELMARWAGTDSSRFYDLYFDRGQPVFIYTPDYYRTMALRLHVYGGQAYTPSQTTWAIAANERKAILESRVFATFAEGEAFVAKDPAKWRLAGKHPLLSPVPIEALPHFARVFESSQGTDGPIGRIPEVSVYRVLPSGQP